MEVPERLGVLATSGVVRIWGPGIAAGPSPELQIGGIRQMLTGSNGRCIGRRSCRLARRCACGADPSRICRASWIKVKNQARLIVRIDLLAQSVASEVDVGDVEPVTAAHLGRLARANPSL